MRPNKLRALLTSNKPTLSTHIHTTWPSFEIEVRWQRYWEEHGLLPRATQPARVLDVSTDRELPPLV